MKVFQKSKWCSWNLIFLLGLSSGLTEAKKHDSILDGSLWQAYESKGDIPLVLVDGNGTEIRKASVSEDFFQQLNFNCQSLENGNSMAMQTFRDLAHVFGDQSFRNISTHRLVRLIEWAEESELRDDFLIKCLDELNRRRIRIAKKYPLGNEFRIKVLSIAQRRNIRDLTILLNDPKKILTSARKKSEKQAKNLGVEVAKKVFAEKFQNGTLNSAHITFKEIFAIAATIDKDLLGEIPENFAYELHKPDEEDPKGEWISNPPKGKAFLIFEFLNGFKKQMKLSGIVETNKIEDGNLGYLKLKTKLD